MQRRPGPRDRCPGARPAAAPSRAGRAADGALYGALPELLDRQPAQDTSCGRRGSPSGVVVDIAEAGIGRAGEKLIEHQQAERPHRPALRGDFLKAEDVGRERRQWRRG